MVRQERMGKNKHVMAVLPGESLDACYVSTRSVDGYFYKLLSKVGKGEFEIVLLAQKEGKKALIQVMSGSAKRYGDSEIMLEQIKGLLSVVAGVSWQVATLKSKG